MVRFTSVWLVCAAAVLAQSTGRITGSVVDATGAVVPGASVQLYLAAGAKPVLSTETTSDGLFSLLSVRPALYDLTIEATGFVKTTLRALKVDPSRSTDLAPIRLELPTVTQSIDVSAAAQTVQTSNAEVSSTVSIEQVRRLPVLDRDPLMLLQTQAGVVSNARANTVVNGQRTSYSNLTLDGINIQDNFIRDNGLDYTPNLLLLGQVAEFTVSTSNPNAAMGGGSSQMAFVTPSGTNQLHAAAYWDNRNNFFAANDWFDNQAGVNRPRLNQNQLGASLAGPVRKDRFFYFVDYEAFRQHEQSPANNVILTDNARKGIFTYSDTGNVVRQVDLLTLRGISTDPIMQNLLAQVPTGDKINNFDVGDSRSGLLRNNGGYRFLQRSNRVRDNVIGKLDYNLSTRNSFTGSYAWNHDELDRPDIDGLLLASGTVSSYSAIPKVSNSNHSHFLSTAWRWMGSPRLTNELRGGFNLAPGDFTTAEKFGAYVLDGTLDGTLFNSPVNNFLPQGRATNTSSISDNAAYQRGRHKIQFGFHSQRTTARTSNDAGILPDYTIGFSLRNPVALQARDLPGIRSADLATANALLATLGGYISGYSQYFNVTSRTSGFVAGAGSVQNFRLNQYAWYLTDEWKLKPRLSLTLGLRHEIFGVPDERDSLLLTPIVTNGDVTRTLLSDSTLDFAGSSAGRPWYNRDLRNFAPNVGLAWDVFGTGKTAVRAAYSIHYVNDETLYSSQYLLSLNAGLVGSSVDVTQTGRLSDGIPKIPVPDFHVPRTFADNYANDPTSAFGLVNPSLKTPYVQQWNFSLQQEIKGTIFDLRYVGNHSTRGIRAFDLNQVVIRENGFLDDFVRARNNGFLAVKNGGAFNPRYNPAIAGSQPLTVFPKLEGGGYLTDSGVRNLIQRGEVGELAAEYQTAGENGSVNFFRNPIALGADLLTNFSNSAYNALQVEVRRHLSQGLDFQANYTFSKVLSDSAGTSSTRLEHFLDSANPRIERARADFDLTHAIKANASWDLPFGKGHALNWRPVSRALSGWMMSGFWTWQSGTPFSILSSRATLNRGGTRSDPNTAVTSLTKGQLDPLLQFRMTGDGPYFIAASAINPADGRGASADGSAPFTGQVFSHPDPGTVGNLQRRAFSGPWTFNIDFGLRKTTAISEKMSLELRMDAFNVLNHPTFFVADQVLDSTAFGKVTDSFNSRRQLQFGLYLKF